MAELLPQDVFEIQGRRYRLLTAFDRPEAGVVVIALDKRNKVPEEWLLSKRNPTKDPSFQVLEDYAAFERPHTESALDVERGKRAYACIKDILHRKGIYDGELLAPMLREHSVTLAKREVHVCAKTLLRWLIKYWRGGSLEAALYTNFFRSGHIDESTEGALEFQQTTLDGKKSTWLTPEGRGTRGRKPRRGKKYCWKPGERRKVLERAWAHLAADYSKSVHGAYVAILAELYSMKDKFGIPLFDGRGRAVLHDDIPSKHQIEYACTRVFAASHLYRMRHGRHEYDNNVKPRNGSVLQDTIGPGDVFEVDATTMDIFLVDRKTRKTVIGKPTLYLVIDRWSRLIVGFHVSLENPSWSEAKLAIASLCTSWKDIGKELGVKVLDSDCVDRRWPNRFFADRSEFMTQASEALAEGISTMVTNAKAKMPADKPIVESGFRVLQAPLRQWAKGYEPPENYMKRRGRAYFRDACWTLTELREAVFRIILFHNRTWKPGYEASEAEIWLGLSLAPLDIWRRGIKARMGAGKAINGNLVLAALSPRAKALMTANGIHWAHCWYEIPDHKEWQVIAKLKGSTAVDITYSTSLVDKIVVHDPNDRRKSYAASLQEKSKKWSGSSKAERHAAWRNEVDNAKAGDRERIAYEVALYLQICEINEAAERATALAIKDIRPGTRKVKGVKAREDEAKDERKKLHDVAKYFRASGNGSPRNGAAKEQLDDGGVDMSNKSGSERELVADGAHDAKCETDDPYFRPQRER